MNNAFLTGEKIDLCVPEETDFEQWASWFNNKKNTQFLEQGKYPNNINQQRLFFEQAVSSGRFICLIKDKKCSLLGVISLSEINHEKSSCQISLVCPESSREAPLAPLEAMAIATQHAFDRFGMERVWAGQAFPGLQSWSQRLEIIGYYTEGFHWNAFRHGINKSHSIHIACSKERYLKILEKRGGSLWAGESKMKKLVRNLKAHRSLAEEAHDALAQLHLQRTKLLDEIEIHADC